MTDSDRVITASRLPTPAEIAAKLGVEPYNLSPVRQAHDGSASVDATIDGRLERVAIVIDTAASWPPKPAPAARAVPAFRLPPKYRREREARERRQAERAAQRRAIEAHYAGLRHMAEPVIASARVTECVPAWLLAAKAVDAERSAHGVHPPVSATVAAALGLGDVAPPPRRRPGR
jgi:hypothetical protein